MPDLLQRLEAFPDWIEAAVRLDPRLGYLMLGLAMLLENLIPPIPSELIQPLGGFLVYQGRLELLPVILAGVTGTVLGAWFWYLVGRWIGEQGLLALIERHGGRLGIGPEELDRSRAWFRRHGLPLMVWGRLIPGIRTLISVPAGVEGLAQGPFLLATLVGSLIWVSALTFAGLYLGEGSSGLIQLAGPYARICRLLLLGIATAAALAIGLRAWRLRSST